MMKKKITQFALTLLFLVPPISFSEPRGWGAGFGIFDGDLGIHGRKDFSFGEELQYGVVLQGGVYDQNKWTGRFDADFQYIFRTESTFRFYPLAGLNWAIQSKENRFGANLGGGATFDLNSETVLFLEAKYVISDWDGFAITTGIYF